MRLGVVTAILYCVQFSPELNDAEVERIADMVLERPFYDLAVEEEYAGIEAVLAAPDWEDDLSWQPHAEAAVRDFLRRLLQRLDALRPWREPPFRSLESNRWEEYRTGRLLAHVRLYPPPQDPLFSRLRPVPGDEHELRATLLRLRSGDEVALIAPPSSGTGDAALMAVAPHRPAPQVIEAFVTHTGYARERVTPAVRRWWRRPVLPAGVRPTG
ncbi:hypothetical protein [Streptomyces panaciradicis]|uniref:hypothetical protein n=1 Tax=Streptomyces panaciradicis TaxID=1470261 RepID=UPI00201D2384|nr:hypothetical protein [Streptomyces panaciradicis]MCL6669164.1 hypothetical protein [Streptomyces panaciradicis]